MTDADAIENGIQALRSADLKNLYGRLGAYTEQFQNDPQAFAEADAQITIQGQIAGGAMDEMVDLGKRITAQCSKKLYAVTCDSRADSAQARKSILDALGLKSADALAASLTSVLVGSFGMAPAIAVVIAVILARVLLPATREGICEYWKAKL